MADVFDKGCRCFSKTFFVLDTWLSLVVSLTPQSCTLRWFQAFSYKLLGLVASLCRVDRNLPGLHGLFRRFLLRGFFCVARRLICRFCCREFGLCRGQQRVLGCGGGLGRLLVFGHDPVGLTLWGHVLSFSAHLLAILLSAGILRNSFGFCFPAVAGLSSVFWPQSRLEEGQTLLLCLAAPLSRSRRRPPTRWLGTRSEAGYGGAAAGTSADCLSISTADRPALRSASGARPGGGASGIGLFFCDTGGLRGLAAAASVGCFSPPRGRALLTRSSSSWWRLPLRVGALQAGGAAPFLVGGLSCLRGAFLGRRGRPGGGSLAGSGWSITLVLDARRQRCTFGLRPGWQLVNGRWGRRQGAGWCGRGGSSFFGTSLILQASLRSSPFNAGAVGHPVPLFLLLGRHCRCPVSRTHLLTTGSNVVVGTQLRAAPLLRLRDRSFRVNVLNQPSSSGVTLQGSKGRPDAWQPLRLWWAAVGTGWQLGVCHLADHLQRGRGRVGLQREAWRGVRAQLEFGRMGPGRLSAVLAQHQRAGNGGAWWKRLSLHPSHCRSAWKPCIAKETPQIRS